MSSQIYLGFLAEDKTVPGVVKYLFWMSGVFFLGLVLMVWFMRRRERAILVSFLFPVIFAFVLLMTPDINVNHKYIMISYAFLTIFWAWAVCSLWKGRNGQSGIQKTMGKILAIVLVISLSVTGIYDFVVIIKGNGPGRRVTVNMNSELTQWLEENLEKNDLLLTPEYSMNEVTMSGAMLYCGWPYYAWSAGYDTNYRAAQAVTIYTTSDSETLEKTVLSLNESRGKDPATWDEVLLDIDEVYENYTLVSTNHLQEFISFNEPYIESVTGHYACAVSALLACGAYYNAVDYTDIAGDYMDIWDSTGTTVSSESGGITYGSTTIGNIGPGFVDFCAGKNVSVTQNTDYSPNYNFFTNCIDRGDIAVVHCGIISSDTGERAGHSMAAEGYATLRAYNSGNTVHTLMVFDGWGDTVRYLNFDFDSWTDISGTTFNG